MRKFGVLVGLVVAITALHLIGVFGGLYARGVGIDMPQHIIFGFGLGLVWIWWIGGDGLKSFGPVAAFLSIVSFAVLGSVFWEFFEYGVWSLLPAFADGFKLYSPTVGELLGDVLSGLVGGCVAALFYLWKRRDA